MAEPKCPTCQASGVDKIVAADSELKSTSGKTWFEIVHCKSCGHVYGVFAKRVLGDWFTNQHLINYLEARSEVANDR